MVNVLFHGVRKALTKAELEACDESSHGKEGCRARHAGYFCNRDQGHTGVHIAAGVASVVHQVWIEAYPEVEPTESTQQMDDRIHWSDQQCNAFAAASKGGHVMIAGSPGGGKSTVSREIYLGLPDDIRHHTERICFNTHGRDKDKEVLGDTKNIVTYSGLAWRIFSRHFGLRFQTWKPANGKRHRLFYSLCAQDFWPDASSNAFDVDQLQALDDLKRVHEMVLATLFSPAKFADPDAIDRACLDWGIDLTLPAFIYQSLPKLMRWTVCGLDQPVDGMYWRVQDTYEFDDLSYMIATTPSIRVETKRVLMPGEMQDATLADWIVMRRRLGAPAYVPGESRPDLPGQLIGEGDMDQSVYRFRFVRADMWGRIVSATGSRVCPLTVSYRMAHELLPRPQEIVSKLSCYPGNPRGEDREIDIAEVLTLVEPGHVLLFLTNMQAVRMAMWGIRHSKPFVVRGTEIGVDMNRHAEFMAKRPGFSFKDMPRVCEDWLIEQEAFIRRRYRQENIEGELQNVRERSACLLYLWEGAWEEGVRTMADFKKRITDLFKDEHDAHGAAAICMTYHKAKGLEFPVVYCEEADLTSVRTGIHPETAREHRRLLYVGLTRPMTTRYVIRNSLTVRNTNRMV